MDHEIHYAGLKVLVGTLAMPFPIFLALVMLGALLLALGRRRAGSISVAGGVLLLTIAAWGPVAEGLLAPLENRYPPLIDASGLDPVAAVVILGGGWQPNPDQPITSQLNESSTIRLFEGLRLLRALPEARLIVSGGTRRADRAPVAQGYAQAARELGVPAATDSDSGYVPGHRPGSLRGPGGARNRPALRAGDLRRAHAARRAAFSAGRPRPDSRSDPASDRPLAARPPGELAAVVWEPEQDRAGLARVSGVAGAGVGALSQGAEGKQASRH